MREENLARTLHRSFVASLAFCWRTGLSHKVFVASAHLQAVLLSTLVGRQDLVEPTRFKFRPSAVRQAPFPDEPVAHRQIGSEPRKRWFQMRVPANP